MTAAAKLALSVYLRARAEAWRPPPRLTVSQVADQLRQMTAETSSWPGQWVTDRVPFTREIMDALGSRKYRRVVFMKGSQIAGTEIGLNWVLFNIVHDPAPMMMVMPTLDVAKKYSKRRIATMIAACMELRKRVASARSRDSGNTLLVKEFPGGVLVITGANSPAGLRSDPARDLFCDEIDAYDQEAGDEGDPLALAVARLSTFSSTSVEYYVSSPGTKGRSKIEPLFLEGDQRHYYLPCPHCGAFDWIRWANLKWTPGKPETIELMCEHCGVLIPEGYKNWMLERGQWRPTLGQDGKPVGDGQTASFHLSSLYSPLGWLSWEKLAREWEVANAASKTGNNRLLKVFVNTRLGETWEERGFVRIDPDSLLHRAEKYAAQVPKEVGALISVTDVHDARFETFVYGVGAGREFWLVDWKQHHGDPADRRVQFALDAYLQSEFQHEGGRRIRIMASGVDTGGHRTNEMYLFCLERLERQVFALKGTREVAKPIVGRPSLRNRVGVPLYLLCVNSAKDEAYARLKITPPGPGAIHFPDEPWFDEEMAAQFVSEQKHPVRVPGGWANAWEPVRDRNEAWDGLHYAIAVVEILGHDFMNRAGEMAAALNRPLEPEPANPIVHTAPAMRSSWVYGGWKG